jgi:hypothetical protein
MNQGENDTVHADTMETGTLPSGVGCAYCFYCCPYQIPHSLGRKALTPETAIDSDEVNSQSIGRYQAALKQVENAVVHAEDRDTVTFESTYVLNLFSPFGPSPLSQEGEIPRWRDGGTLERRKHGAGGQKRHGPEPGGC